MAAPQKSKNSRSRKSRKQPSDSPRIIHPGEILRDKYMRPRRLTAKQLANAIGVPEELIAAFIAGQVDVTPELATKLGNRFPKTHLSWMTWQADYDLAVSRQQRLSSCDQPIGLEVDPAIYNRDEACAWAVWRDARMVGLIGPPGTRGKYSFQALLRAGTRYPADLWRKLRSPIPPRVGDSTDVVQLHADDHLRARRRVGSHGPLLEVPPAEWRRGWPAGELIIDAVKLRARLPANRTGQAEAAPAPASREPSEEPAGDGDPSVAAPPEDPAACVTKYLATVAGEGRTPSFRDCWKRAPSMGYTGTRRELEAEYPEDKKGRGGVRRKVIHS